MWKVEHIELTGDARSHGHGAHYRYRIRGVNTETGERFSWSVPDFRDPRYDLSEAHDPDAVLAQQEPKP